jgi:hypothetical protein
MQNPFRDKIHSTLFVPSFDSNSCNPVLNVIGTFRTVAWLIYLAYSS